MRSTVTLLCGALIAVGALAGFYGGWKRYQVEGLNRRVELALEYAEVKTLAQMTNQPLPKVLARFQAAGVTSLAITEETLGGLEAQGELRAEKSVTGSTTVDVRRESVYSRLQVALRAKGVAVSAGPPPPGAPQGTSFSLYDGRPFFVPVDYTSLRTLGVGLDPEAVKTTQQSGLLPVGRIANFPAVSPTTMANVLRDVKRQGVQTVVFQGLEVLGFRDQEKEAAEALRAAGLHYGQVEFGKQKGDDKLGIALKGGYVRVHSIGEGEMGQLDENEAIDRFVRAARERNIRLCYLRFITLAGADPVQENVEYLQKITKGIARDGEMEFGAAHLFAETNVPRWAFGLMAVGVAGGLTLLLLRLAPVSDRVVWLTLVGALIACIGASVGLGEMGRKLTALLAALIFPTLASLRRDVLNLTPQPPSLEGRHGGLPLRSSLEPALSLPKGKGERGSGADSDSPFPPSALRPRSLGTSGAERRLRASVGAGGLGPLRFALRGLFAASLVTLLGILHIVGLLATRPFMLKANQFLGIKAAHAVPILLIGALAITGTPRLDRPWAEEWARLKERTARFLGEPTRVGQLLLLLVALVALAMVVARTGNEPGVGVSGIELKLRSLLDRALPVRPRTKEFLLGHPAFVLALALWFRGRRRWALPLYVVGVTGQVSLLNTFCHIHTPLHLSLIRDVTGLVFGAVLGLAAFWIVETSAIRSQKSANGNKRTSDG